MHTKWTQVDRYIVDSLVETDEVLETVLFNNARANLPAHDVAPNQGKLLALFAQMVGARRILEIGTLGAYSTIWMARALPAGGQVVTLEADPHHARIAQTNIELAGLGKVITLHQGPALETLPTLPKDQPFDMIFIDADKPSNPEYLQWALALSHPGTLIVAEPRLTATALQTVGSKGWDGFTLALVKG